MTRALTVVFFYIGKFIIKKVYGSDGMKLREQNGKDDKGLCIFISLILALWFMCLILSLTLKGSSWIDILLCVLIIIGVPLSFVLWGVLARRKVKDTFTDDTLSVQNENKTQVVKSTHPETPVTISSTPSNDEDCIKNDTDKKVNLFMKIYMEDIIPVLKSSPLVHNATFELLPAMFIIADFAAAQKNKNRAEYAKAIVTHLTDAKLLNDDNTPIFHSRLSLYGKIIRGEKEPRGDWVLTDVASLANSFVGVVAVVLGDILINPACADDYDNAPLALYDIDKLMNYFQNTMTPTFQSLRELFKGFSKS